MMSSSRMSSRPGGSSLTTLSKTLSIGRFTFWPMLTFPYSSDVRGSKHGNMRELRIQARGEPYRIFYAFDPLRTAILLIGAGKVGDDHFYERMIPIADRLYDEFLNELGRESGAEHD